MKEQKQSLNLSLPTTFTNYVTNSNTVPYLDETDKEAYAKALALDATANEDYEYDLENSL